MDPLACRLDVSPAMHILRNYCSMRPRCVIDPHSTNASEAAAPHRAVKRRTACNPHINPGIRGGHDPPWLRCCTTSDREQDVHVARVRTSQSSAENAAFESPFSSFIFPSESTAGLTELPVHGADSYVVLTAGVSRTLVGPAQTIRRSCQCPCGSNHSFPPGESYDLNRYPSKKFKAEMQGPRTARSNGSDHAQELAGNALRCVGGPHDERSRTAAFFTVCTCDDPAPSTGTPARKDVLANKPLLLQETSQVDAHREEFDGVIWKRRAEISAAEDLAGITRAEPSSMPPSNPLAHPRTKTQGASRDSRWSERASPKGLDGMDKITSDEMFPPEPATTCTAHAPPALDARPRPEGHRAH
ncbi:hypothetical protein EVG20_g5608 [Dentipellis fragilis]|uniref:Uncharacterized protein n=1 Tax=Dentipellis fragilis TaxID=205917 RepID=A0A4Y9YSK9_9AGAM|nr:hypothetical protein EVG20_g5608 [Dentipellis fragilis]